MAKLFVEQGADVNGQDNDGLTPLITAASEGDQEMVELLVEELGADVNGQGEDGSAPLPAAVLKCNQKVAEFLIKRGANVNIRNKKGLTALYIAVFVIPIFDNDHKMAEFLIKKGADVNVETKNGLSPLTYTIFKGRLSTVKIHIGNGAKVSARDWSGVKDPEIRGYFSKIKRFFDLIKCDSKASNVCTEKEI